MLEPADDAVEVTMARGLVDVDEPWTAARAVDIAIAVERRKPEMVVYAVGALDRSATGSQGIADDGGPHGKAA